MKRNFTQKLQPFLNSKKELMPKASTIDFILGFAASYEVPQSNIQLPGIVLN